MITEHALLNVKPGEESAFEAAFVGFRESEAYQEWKSLLHHFYEPFPLVEHFDVVDRARGAGRQ